MLIHKQWASCPSVSLLFTLLLIATVTLSLLLLRHMDGVSIPRISWAKPSTPKCEADLSAYQLQTFTYGKNSSLEDGSRSLLRQADKILMENSGNNFVQLSEKGSKPKHYGVSMFHQLHCLEILKAAFHHKSHHHIAQRGEDDEDHIEHCFAYLTQAIMCAADDTIEPSFVGETPTGQKVRVINGDGVVHQCRDASGMYEAILSSQTKPFVTERKLRDGDTWRMILNLEK